MNAEIRAADGTGAPLLTASNGDYKEKWKHIGQHIEIRRTNDYCVGIDEKLKIDWGTTEEYDQRELAQEETLRKQRATILTDIAVEEASHRDNPDKDVVIRYKTLLGEAYVLCFEGDFDGAQRTLDSAKKYMTSRSEERSREWYVKASAAATVPFLVTFAILYSVVVFAGHGGYSNAKQVTLLQLSPGVSIEEHELKDGAARHTVIIDACRVHLDKPVTEEFRAKAMTFDRADNTARNRILFDNHIRACAPQSTQHKRRPNRHQKAL